MRWRGGRCGLPLQTTRSAPTLGPFFDTKLPDDKPEAPKEFDFAGFEGRKKNVINALSPYLSKSQSVFCEPMDSLDQMIDGGSQPSVLVSHQLCLLLAASHAFDKGDTHQIEWIDSERRNVIARIDRHRLFPGQAGSLPELDSKDSPLIQAADFAAGIARELWHRYTLPHLASTFGYVTYNGKRISETEASTIDAELKKRA